MHTTSDCAGEAEEATVFVKDKWKELYLDFLEDGRLEGA